MYDKIRPYNLNIGKAVKKLTLAQNRDWVTATQKGDNFVYKFTPAVFMRIKGTILGALSNGGYSITEDKTNQDKTGVIVDQVLKISGPQRQRFTINLYNTTNNIMINGKTRAQAHTAMTKLWDALLKDPGIEQLARKLDEYLNEESIGNEHKQNDKY